MKLKGPGSPRGRGRSRDWHGGLTLERPRPRGLRKRRGQFHLGMTGRYATRERLTHYGSEGADHHRRRPAA